MGTVPATLARRRPATGWRASALPVLGLVLLLGLTAALGDTRAGSGSDAGGRVATVKVMAEGKTWRPDVGYWAASEDSQGRFHPLYNTTAVGDRWIQATSLPFVVAAAPLWDLGGPTGVLLIPMAGCVLAALGARRLAQLLGARDGWPAFWLIGAAGAAFFYAGDFWEHAPALGLALVAITLALEAERPPRALLAGLVAGVAVVLRAEMVVYGLAFVVAIAADRDLRARWARAPRLMGAAIAGAAAPVLVNGLVERILVDTGIRDSRAGATLSDTGHGLGTRATDALLTSVAIFPEDTLVALALGVALVAGLVVLAVAAVRPERVPDRLVRVAAVLVTALYLGRLAQGLGFVPGCIAAAPLAVLGLVGARRGASRVLVLTAVGAIPLVWLVQWKGNHIAQWGGRYLLLSAALLVVVASVVAERVGWRRPTVVLLTTLTIGVGVFGAAWHIRRTNVVADAVAAIEAAPSDVVMISADAHLPREGGSTYGEHRWLRAEGPGAVEDAASVAAELGVERVDVIQRWVAGEPAPEPVDLREFVQTGQRTVPYLGSDLVVTRYEQH